jgi:hypothetical protein
MFIEKRRRKMYCSRRERHIKEEVRMSETNATSPSRELRTETDRANQRAKDPIAFLYFSIVLTSLTVLVALIIGTIQLLTLILNVAYPDGSYNRFWNGVNIASNNYDIIEGGICGSFVVVGLASVVVYRPWRRWVEAKQAQRFGIEKEDGDDKDRENEAVNLSVSRKTGSTRDTAEGLKNRKNDMKRAVKVQGLGAKGS